VIRGTKIEIETIRRSRESAAPAPASTAQQEAAAVPPPQRPESPTAAYCLLPGFYVRWDGETRSIQPLLWALLAYLLSPEAVEVEEQTLVDEVWGHDSKIKSKTVANTIYRLNEELVPINFPWTWRTKAGKVIRD
jgi:DNA-binding response OmpR family regulator